MRANSQIYKFWYTTGWFKPLIKKIKLKFLKSNCIPVYMALQKDKNGFFLHHYVSLWNDCARITHHWHICTCCSTAPGCPAPPPGPGHVDRWDTTLGGTCHTHTYKRQRCKLWISMSSNVSNTWLEIYVLICCTEL